MSHGNDWSEVEVISKYSREEAIGDGELVDVTPLAATPLGALGRFTVPVAMTRALFAVASDFDVFSGEDVRARILDILTNAILALRLSKTPPEPFICFQVLLTDSQGAVTTHDLILHCGPGDTTDPVVTIGFAEDF